MEKKHRKKLFMTSTSLKVFTAVTLFCYYFSTAVLQRSLLGADRLSIGAMRDLLRTDSGAMSLAGAASFLQLVGGLGLPVAAFLLAEGFVHTKDLRRYLLRLLGFALLSEIPYDLAMSGRWVDLGEQNLLFSLAVGLILLYGLRLFEGKPGLACRLAQAAILAASVLWSMLLRSEFGFFLLVMAAVYYLMRDRKGLRILMGCAMSVMYVTAPLSGYVLWLYEGGKGKEVPRLLFYGLYPVLLLALAALRAAIG